MMSWITNCLNLSMMRGRCSRSSWSSLMFISSLKQCALNHNQEFSIYDREEEGRMVFNWISIRPITVQKKINCLLPQYLIFLRLRFLLVCLTWDGRRFRMKKKKCIMSCRREKGRRRYKHHRTPKEEAEVISFVVFVSFCWAPKLARQIGSW